jgi:hypothetical protein
LIVTNKLLKAVLNITARSLTLPFLCRRVKVEIDRGPGLAPEKEVVHTQRNSAVQKGKDRLQTRMNLVPLES